LKHSLQLLVSEANIRLGELPDFCLRSGELFLSFNKWRMALVGNFQSEISLTNHLASTRSNGNSDIWTVVCDQFGGMETHPPTIKQTLEAFGWSHYERGAIILLFVRSLLLSGTASGIGRGNTCAELSYRSGGDALGIVELRTS